jgi:hypothetical protein
MAHVRGEAQLRTRVIDVPGSVDVRAIREKTGMSYGSLGAASFSELCCTLLWAG